MKKNFIFAFSGTIAILSLSAFAHGGGSAPEKKTVRSKEVQRSRLTPSHPEALQDEQLEVFASQKEIARDVVVIRCRLNEFSLCRGLEIVLLNLEGRELARAHTKTSGFVGFEGLQANANYIVRIASEKYYGETQIQSGSTFVVDGKRR